MYSRKKDLGFTLIELLIVVVVLAIIAAISLPSVVDIQNKAKTNACKANIANINVQMEKYYLEHGSEWPALADLTTNLNYFPDGPPTCPYGTDDYVLNDTTHHVTPHSH